MNSKFKSLLLSVLLSNSLLADDYQLYFQGDNQSNLNSEDLIIVNTSAGSAKTVNLDEYSSGQDYYSRFDSINGISADSVTFNNANNASGRSVKDIIGSNIVIENTGILNISYDDPDNETQLSYDRIVKLDLNTGEKTSEILYASTQEEYDVALEAGFTAILIESDVGSSDQATSLTTYSANLTNVDSTIVTNGGFSTNQIAADDGASLFRVEDDGTVHIGENSIVLADELVSASGNDEIYSSSGTLQLGNDSTHNTIVVGTIEVPDPTLDSHAANKRYVDDQILKANKYSDGIGSMALASSSMLISSNGREGIGLGIAGIGSSSALAIGITGNYNERTNYSLSSSYSNQVEKLGISGGVHFAW